MYARMILPNDAIVDAKPASEYIDQLDIDLCIYTDGGDNITLLMSEAKGREIVEKLTEQLDKVESIKQSRIDANKRMLDSIKALSGSE